MPRRVLVVDDELAGLRKVHVEGVVPNFYETIADTTDPRFESLRSISLLVPSAQQFVGDEGSAADYFATDDAVRDVLLSAELAAGAIQPLKDLLAPFIARSARVESLRAQFLAAFPAPEFVVDFAGAPRPAFAVVTLYDALFLDLFLEDGAIAPVDQMKAYLEALAEQAAAQRLPPIVLMSMHDELSEHKRDFSEGARISAAGLMVLPKEKISQPQFGAVGLRLSFDQLSRQSGVAHSMRLFIGAWMRALAKATEGTSKTLWNLDASAMQQIHLASVRDDDPYDEHLNELLSREHLFRVESDIEVGSKLGKLDEQFRALLASDTREIENRLIAPMTDVGTSRALMSHFTWLGARPNLPFLRYLPEESAENVSRSLPFGSVLCGPVITENSRCLVHITQQCDLNAISRERSPAGTLVFAIAEARELQPSDNPIVSTSDLVARSLQIDEDGVRREFDLRILVGEMVAMSLHSFVSKMRHERLRVVGRLRSDIAHQIVAATSNHMSRPASQLMLRPGLLRSKVFLQSAAYQGGKLPLLEAPARGRIFSLTFEKDLYSFQDEACVEISLWLTRELSQLGVQVEVDALCTALRKGWRTAQPLIGGVTARVRECEDIGQAFKALVKGDIQNNQVQFTVVIEK
jgi:CheY-like chemotaxis protein